MSLPDVAETTAEGDIDNGIPVTDTVCVIASDDTKTEEGGIVVYDGEDPETCKGQVKPAIPLL